MKYTNIVSGIFIERLNRFVAKVTIADREELVHVKNTGRCLELFKKGALVYLEPSNNPNRKTKYSLISIYKNDVLINIDSQAPNAILKEALYLNKIDSIQFEYLKPEFTYGQSRLDFYFETPQSNGLYYFTLKNIQIMV